MSSLRVVTAGLDLMAEALRDQGADVTALEWRPPAGGDPEDVAVLAATYGDDRVDAANALALARLQEARPMIVGAGAAGELIPGLEGRTVLHAGPPVEWELMCRPQRNAVCGAVGARGLGLHPRGGRAHWSPAAACGSPPPTRWTRPAR